MSGESLYVATRGHLVKIGIAWNPERRVRRQKATMFWCSGPYEGAGWAEHASCQMLARYVVPGKREWFNARPELALRVVLRVIRRSHCYRSGLASPAVAEAVGVSPSLIYQRARGVWASRIAEGGGK